MILFLFAYFLIGFVVACLVARSQGPIVDVIDAIMVGLPCVMVMVVWPLAVPILLFTLVANRG